MVSHVPLLKRSYTRKKRISMTEDKDYIEARKRVKRKKDFYEHFTTYLVISIFLLALNMITSPGRWWWHWPVMGWGMAVLFNYLDVFGIPGVGPMNKEWEKQAIEEELTKIKQQERNGLPAPEKKEELKLRQLDLEKREQWDDGDLV